MWPNFYAPKIEKKKKITVKFAVFLSNFLPQLFVYGFSFCLLKIICLIRVIECHFFAYARGQIKMCQSFIHWKRKKSKIWNSNMEFKSMNCPYLK